MSRSQLYLISEGVDGPIKIGRSVSAPNRLCTLQTGNPRQLSILATYWMRSDEVAEAEKILHEELAKHSIIGEWFGFPEWFILGYMPDFFGAHGFEVSA